MAARQVNKLQAGHERCERLAAGSDGRATLAHELVRAPRARFNCCTPLRERSSPRSRGAQLLSTGGRVRQRSLAGASRALCSRPLPRALRSHARSGRQLEELERATAMAESDYARFRIEKAELASRRSWNGSTRAQVRRSPEVFVFCRGPTLSPRVHAGGGAEEHTCSSGAGSKSQLKVAGWTVRRVQCLAPHRALGTAHVDASAAPQNCCCKARKRDHQPERIVSEQPD